MTSYQSSAGAGKAAKFVAANPLGPIADPFAGLDDDQKEYQKVLSENVNNRLTSAMEDLKEKHATGRNEVDDEDRAPTGAAYRARQAEVEKQRNQSRLEEEKRRVEEAKRITDMKEVAERLMNKCNQDCSEQHHSDLDSDDEYDELLDGLDGDPELEAIRDKRLKEMRESQIKQAENLAKGHGHYRLIFQDDFLTECTGSEFVVVHFFHKEFERCKIMDHHLGLIAPLHTSCKFVKIDAEKAPFFVDKLKVKTLPTLIIFRDGKVVARLCGFEGLAEDATNPDKWHTSKLQQWISKSGAIEYCPPTEEVMDEMRRLGIQPKGVIWSSSHAAQNCDFDN